MKTLSKSAKKNQPKSTAQSKKIIEYLDGNFTFNKFGVVNLNAIRATTGVKMDDKEMKKIIKARFAKEIHGKIEFI